MLNTLQKTIKNFIKNYFGFVISIYRKVNFHLEIISGKEYVDFFMFPFDPNTPMPASAFEVMKKGVSILQDLNVPYSLADGTLLGVFRDNRLIPHDTDIDVTVLYPVDTKKIEDTFIKNGFTIGRKVVAMGKVQQLIFYSPDRVLFDIIFYTKIRDDVYAFSEKDYYLKHQADHYENLASIELNGLLLSIPQHTELWLEHVYGRSWKTPKAEKPNDWREGGVEYLTAIPYDGDVKKLIRSIENPATTDIT